MDNQTRERLIREHMSRGDVIAVQVWRRTPNSVELDELKAIAYSGLVSAANAWENYCFRHEYDPERIEFFTPYVVRRMHGAILDELRKSDWLSKTQRAQVKRIQAARQTEGGSDLKKIAASTGLTEDAIRVSLAQLEDRPVSLDSGDGLDVGVSDSSSSALLDFFVNCVASLDPPEQAVITLRFFSEMDFSEIALLLKIEQKEVKRIYNEATITIYEAINQAWPYLT